MTTEQLRIAVIAAAIVAIAATGGFVFNAFASSASSSREMTESSLRGFTTATISFNIP
jgi:hypothetical protein